MSDEEYVYVEERDVTVQDVASIQVGYGHDAIVIRLGTYLHGEVVYALPFPLAYDLANDIAQVGEDAEREPLGPDGKES